MEDALGRHRLEKRLANKASPPDDGNSPDPGGKDHDNSDDSDDDDDNEGDDQHKPKRRRKRDQDARGAAGPSTLDVSPHGVCFFGSVTLTGILL